MTFGSVQASTANGVSERSSPAAAVPANDP